MTKKINLFSNLKADISSGLVVFLVALPLCLGIALASGAPLFSGIISGVVGGIVVGLLSQSQLSVSGPAAGLTAIVLTAISELGVFNVFLMSVIIAGVLQIILGYLKAGAISHYFPTNVIEGMLAGIGVIIFLKQIPHAFGYDPDYEGDLSFFQIDGKNTFTEIFSVLNHIQLGSILITAISLIILIYWNSFSSFKKVKMFPPALVAVLISILLNELFSRTGSIFKIEKNHLVNLPIPTSIEEYKNIFFVPDFAAISNKKVWIIGFTIAIVASIETLLCIEAADRMDKQKRYTDTNVELKAQGIGNIISALLGGLPMTSVVVRTSANNAAGAKSKMSTIVHGILLLISVIIIPNLLNKIPIATLAAVLLLVGYKLANPKVIKHFYEKGKYQFIPFMATFLAVVLTDLLKGVALGMIISIIFVLKGNMKRAFTIRKEKLVDGEIVTQIDLAQEVSFLNKAAIKNTLASIQGHSKVIINASDTVYIAHDVLDLIKEFKEIKSKDFQIDVKLIGFKEGYEIENSKEVQQKIIFEHQYDALKRKTIKIETNKTEFIK